MKERTISHIALCVLTSFGVYWALSKPYGLTLDRIYGLFIIFFSLWMQKINFESLLKEELTSNMKKSKQNNKGKTK